ncbi:hypothetical protein [Flavobacterium mesophilum]|uniref:hypothetical protein n=1 Tax=Flavobacterium mesophilum TaxID=3143495 RepID=UPI0031D89D74
MEKRIIILISSLFLNITVFAQRISIPVSQTDSRFTFSVERSSTMAGGSEYYYFYVQNNTNIDYKLNFEITLELACAGTKTISLRTGVSDFLHLAPGGKYDSKNQAQFIYFGKKECAIPVGNKDYTLFKGISYSISNVVDLVKEKEDAATKRKAEDDARAKAKPASRAETVQQNPSQQKTEKSGPGNQQISKNSIITQSNAIGTNNIGLSEKVKVNGQYVQVFRQNGVPYLRNEDGSFHQTTEEAYNQISAASDKKAQPQTLQEIQKQQNDPQILKISQDYARNQQYQAERAEIITKGVTDLGNLVGGWIQQNQAEKARKEALREQRAEEERQRQYALDLKISNRKNAFSQLPSKDIPLSSQEKAASIYYFVYSYNNLDNENGASAYISNVFEIGTYNDGTRAYTATVKNDIAGLSPYAEVLHGYYYTAQQADEKRQELIDILQSSGVAIYDVLYKGKAGDSNAGNNTAEKQRSNYGTVITAPAKVDTRPTNGTAPNSQVDKAKENQTKNYGTIIK